MLDLYKLQIIRWLYYHIFYETKFHDYWYKLLFDYIDYVHGPSQLAEDSAQRTGYWNLEVANRILDNTVKLPDRSYTTLRALCDPITIRKIYKYYKIRKYD